MVEAPPAFPVLDIGADLADYLRGAEGVQEVVLRLEVHAHGDEGAPCRIEGVTGRGLGSGDKVKLKK